MNHVDPITRDPEIDEAFQAAVDAGRNFEDFQEICDFSITVSDHNIFDIVGLILCAGAKMEFGGGLAFVVEDGEASYYFVGRKPEVLEAIRKLVKP